MRHTSGPWSFSFGEVLRVRSKDGSTIANLTHLSNLKRRKIEEVTANAHLVSAAPEMLALLEVIQDIVPASPYRDKIKAVVAKARGEQ